MSKRRVVITGMGTINPLARNVKDTWDRILKGESGITRISKFDPENYQSQVAGEVRDFNFRDCRNFLLLTCCNDIYRNLDRTWCI